MQTQELLYLQSSFIWITELSVSSLFSSGIYIFKEIQWNILKWLILFLQKAMYVGMVSKWLIIFFLSCNLFFPMHLYMFKRTENVYNFFLNMDLGRAQTCPKKITLNALLKFHKTDVRAKHLTYHLILCVCKLLWSLTLYF